MLVLASLTLAIEICMLTVSLSYDSCVHFPFAITPSVARVSSACRFASAAPAIINPAHQASIMNADSLCQLLICRARRCRHELRW